MFDVLLNGTETQVNEYIQGMLAGIGMTALAVSVIVMIAGLSVRIYMWYKETHDGKI